MRLFEMLRRDPFYHLGFTEGLKGIPVFDCDEVAEWYCCYTTQQDWGIEDFPTLAPPYPRIWCDFKAPPYILLEGGKKEIWSSSQPEYWGVDCRWRDATIPNLIESCRKSASIWVGTMKIQEEWINQHKPRWFIDSVLYWRRSRQNQGPIWLQRIYIDQHGCPMKNSDGLTLSVEGPLIVDLVKLKFEYAQEMKVSLEVAEQFLYGQFASFFHNVYLSISFLHCKNIKIKDETPQSKPLNNAQKRRGDLNPKPITYKVLEITPMKKIIQKVSADHHTQGGKSLHFVKGHYHEYTADAPMFGKPGLTGKYFIPFHASGSIQKGITVKDYKINSPK